MVALTVLYVAARIGGELAARLRIPLHVGELLAGICLGPSLLGWLWPSAFAAVFPAVSEQRGLLDVVSWIGIMFLVLAGGLEANLGILRRSRGIVIGGWIGGFGLPFVAGMALGTLAPDSLVPPSIPRLVFTLFLATALAISAIPVIARILMDLDLLKTRVGMVIVSTAVADDTIGWIVLAITAGLATGGLDSMAIARTLLLTAAFLAAAFTVGRRSVKALMRFSRSLQIPYAQISMALILVFAFGTITQAIGVHLVLGCFVAAILIGRFRQLDQQAVTGIRQVGMGVFVPFFFAYTGIKVDLTTLRGDALTFTIVALIVACGSKILGGGLGALSGGLPRWEALAVGLGLNARGAMELVIAAIGLSLGILNTTTYAIIVLIAVITTVMTAPLVKWSVAHAGEAAIRVSSVRQPPDIQEEIPA